MKSETPTRFPMWVLFAAAAIIALVSSSWVAMDQESKMRSLKAEVRTRSELANAYVVRCLLSDNVVSKNIADLPDIPTLASRARSGKDCSVHHYKLLAPEILEIGNGDTLRKGEHCRQQFEAIADDRMYFLDLHSPTALGEGLFQRGGVAIYVRKGKVWAIFEAGEFLPE